CVGGERRACRELCSRLLVLAVREARGVPGAPLDVHVEPGLSKLRDRLRYERDAPLAGSGLLRNGDSHAVANSTARADASGSEPSQRAPDVELRPRPSDHLVRELRRPGMAAEIGGPDPVGDGLEAAFADCTTGPLGRLVVCLREKCCA